MVCPHRSLGPEARRIRRLSVPDSKGLVLFCHGLGLHSSKFQSLYEQVNALGWDVVTFDALGHGNTADIPIDSQSIEQVAAEAIGVYQQHAHERPILLGTGCFGGFTMRRIIASARGSTWQPPAVFYSVDYIRMPGPVLRQLQRGPLLRMLDRIKPGYAYHELTHSVADNVAFIDNDPAAWTDIPLGLGMKLAHEVNTFYDEAYTEDAPHAFIVGTDDTLTHLPPVERAGQRQPNFRLWSVPGGRMHLHRDRPDVRAQFAEALGEALDFVSGQAGPHGLPDDLPSPALPTPPVVGSAGRRAQARLLQQLMVDPVGMVEDLEAQHGTLFTVRIPFDITPPFTFLTTREGYASVLGLDAAVGRNGPIIDRVPALAHWTPRSDPSPDHLQELLLTGRRHIGRLLRGTPSRTLTAGVRATMQRHIQGWTGTVDLADVLVTAIHDTSARLVLGDELMDALGPAALDEVRIVVNAVDAARAVTALTPAGRFLPEARATRSLARRLRRIAEDPTLARAPYLAQLRENHPDMPIEDVTWALFFGLWNATIYMGTYGTWSFFDLLSHPEHRAAVAHADSPQREARLIGGIIETMRRNPISWQLRALSRPVEVTSGGQRYRVPAGHFLSVYSHGLNRDPEVYPNPLAWEPDRYMNGAPQPLLFGAGPFACVAQFFVKHLLATIHAALLDALDFQLLRPLPARMSRVHLLYPSEAVPVVVRPR